MGGKSREAKVKRGKEEGVSWKSFEQATDSHCGARRYFHILVRACVRACAPGCAFPPVTPCCCCLLLPHQPAAARRRTSERASERRSNSVRALSVNEEKDRGEPSARSQPPPRQLVTWGRGGGKRRSSWNEPRPGPRPRRRLIGPRSRSRAPPFAP